ncbi:ABC transporter permease [Desulfopila sp. IMCC35008]|uniref:ABC transporter permease n=1 Tax=Desulfopila sp. IMCC35008 TaxID=2653858 RepID=UPI0013D197EB|nr:ABC transporter permease [Desulfopila sp. IMCC35008]
MKNLSFMTLLYGEFSDLGRDPWLLALVTWVPLLLYATIWWIFSQGIPTELPIGVVDLDKGRVSRGLIRHYGTSPSLKIEQSFPSVSDGAAALRAGEIYGLIVLPEGLEKQLTRGNPPQVSAIINSQFLLVGKLIGSALQQAHGTFTIKVEILRNMTVSTPLPAVALSSAMPIGSQITPLFNMSKNYAWFLVSAILPAIWQIIMVAATVLSMAFVQRHYGLHAWLEGAPITRLLCKSAFLALLFWGQGALFLYFLYVVLGWPMHGDWFLLLISQLVTAVASIGCGYLIFFLTKDGGRSLSLAAAYVAPGLAFMGVTFPVTDMTLPARIWRNLIPVCHYIEIQFGQVNYGIAASSALPKLLSLSLFLLLFIPVFVMSSRMVKRSQGALPGDSP